MAQKIGLDELIIRSMRDGPHTEAGIYRFIGGQYARARVKLTTEKLRADGLVRNKSRRYELTRAGKLAAPSAPQLASHGQYVPPRVVRRAGTEIHRTRYWREA